MKANIKVLDNRRDLYNISEVKISVPEIPQEVLLDIDLQSVYFRFGLPNRKVLDLLFIASIIYILDRLIPRDLFEDNWTREIEVEIPVFKKKKWDTCIKELNNLISFLTGDDWDIKFRKLKKPILRLDKDQQKLDQKSTLKSEIETVSLFSGGLDSLIGAIDILERKSGNIQLLGHYDGNISGVSKSQNDLYSQLSSKYSKRSHFQQIRIGFVKNSATNKSYSFETSTRSRSIIFLALGIYAAESVDDNTNLIIPENGFISINMPFSPSRRGSCSTRTTHPYIIENLNDILLNIGISQKILNPYLMETKGEMIKNCRNLKNLKNLFKYSVSCSKTGHTTNWIRRSASQCGVCVPCIIRRASLYHNSIDNEIYGSDFCKSEVILNTKAGFYQDLRDLINFLDSGYSKEDLAPLLFCNGNYSLDNFNDYVDLVDRGLIELKNILKNKAKRL